MLRSFIFMYLSILINDYLNKNEYNNKINYNSLLYLFIKEQYSAKKKKNDGYTSRHRWATVVGGKLGN